MNILKLLIIFFLINSGAAIKPNGNNYGKKKKFYPDKIHPANDLKVISISEASIITKHWLINIMDIQTSDDHIVDKINKAEEFFQKQYSEQSEFNDLYLAWAPQGKYSQISYIVLSTVDHFNRRLFVNMLIPSPVWDSSQISNLELKKALEDLALKSDADLDLGYLYDNDIRIKMDWTLF